MQKRHSVLSFVCGLAVIAAAGACAKSGADTEHGPIFGAEAGPDARTDAAGSDAPGDDAYGDDAPGSDAAAADAGGDDATVDAGSDAVDDTGSAVDAGSDAASDAVAPVDASEAGSPGVDAGDAGVVAPTCDGVIGAGEYGDATHQLATSTGQTWYVTWDDTNLYVGISGAAVTEGAVIYAAANPADGGTGLTAGYAYDNTDITSLPFAADLVAYANAYANGGTGPYIEARTVTSGAWGAPNTTAVHECVTGGSTATVREEVIPWSLIGGRPASFGWLGYLAAAPSSHPTGYIYGQVPTDDPGGSPANSETYTKYYAVPDATPGVDRPFANEQ